MIKGNDGRRRGAGIGATPMITFARQGMLRWFAGPMGSAWVGGEGALQAPQ
jgi:hypothetical protein